MSHNHAIVWMDSKEAPSSAKLDLLKYLDAHRPELRRSLVGTETMDHPTDGELLDHARRAFKAIDRLLPNSPA